jgi:hypothetical protein
LKLLKPLLDLPPLNLLEVLPLNKKLKKLKKNPKKKWTSEVVG